MDECHHLKHLNRIWVPGEIFVQVGFFDSTALASGALFVDAAGRLRRLVVCKT